MAHQPPTAEIAIIGGSGLYALFDPSVPGFAGAFDVETPYGPPSAPITVAEFNGRKVAFLPRHGAAHQFPPHAVPYRANIAALKNLGVRQILATAAAGSTSLEIPPGAVVVPDQLVDQTRSRPRTFFDSSADSLHHALFAEPYCNRLRAVLIAASAASGFSALGQATMVVTEGPRFETRAETKWYADCGWALVNMTGMPEAGLAREAGICYATLAVAANYTPNVEINAIESTESVLESIAVHAEKQKRILEQALADIPQTQPFHPCTCST